MPRNWPQWRGPQRDGRFDDFALPPTGWPKTLTRVWQVDVGEGHASPVVADGRVYVLTRQGEQEGVLCRDLATGKPLWKDQYATPYTMNPAARGHGKGPKATPAVADGVVVGPGIDGMVSAWDARSGKVLWRKDLRERFPQHSPDFGASASPLIDRGRVFVSFGGGESGALTALDLKTGKPLWEWTGDSPGYASPILITVGRARQLVTQTRKQVIALDPDKGALLWSAPFTTPYDQNIITPVLAGDLLLIGGTQKSTLALRPAAGAPQKAWETRDATFYMSTPIVRAGRVWGFSERRGGQMVSLDPESGKVLWTGEGRQGDNASVWDTGERILALTTDAQLTVYRKKEETLAEEARYPVAQSAVWASPAFVGNRILVKDIGSLTAWDAR